MKLAKLARPFILAAFVSVFAPAARAEMISYTHDPAGRITGENYASGSSITYQYDPVGNHIQTTANTVAIDSDNDGMNDAWELQYFGTLSRDGSDDYDLDGMSDAAEFLAGTNPLLSESFLHITRLTLDSGGSTLEWTSVPGKHYRLDYKDSLPGAMWFELPGETIADGFAASATDNSPSGITGRFYRVAVVSNPSSP